MKKQSNEQKSRNLKLTFTNKLVNHYNKMKKVVISFQLYMHLEKSKKNI